MPRMRSRGSLTRPRSAASWTQPRFLVRSASITCTTRYPAGCNTWSIRVFGRTDNAKPGDPPNEPRRVIGGPKTDIQFNSCVWVDPASGNIYSVENDIGDVIVVFLITKRPGRAEPKRKLKVTHPRIRMASMTRPKSFSFRSSTLLKWRFIVRRPRETISRSRLTEGPNTNLLSDPMAWPSTPKTNCCTSITGVTSAITGCQDRAASSRHR